MTTWDPRTYLQYADVRFRAGLDLMKRIPPKAYSEIYDLGCGTGFLTSRLAETFPNASVTGLDSSPEMLAEARRDHPSLTWQQSDIVEWSRSDTTDVDLIYSNAALQWVPGHETLVPALLKKLRPGGVLAVQVPRHFESPSHLGLRDIVQESPRRAELEPLLIDTVPSPQTYYSWLMPHAAQLDIWETIYLLVLDGPDPVMNFMRGSALRPFLTILPKHEGEQLLAEFANRMAKAYPPQPDGRTLFPFRRLFILAQR
jgi:trans-aconitate 2-methyltransferase